jgi:hypothetical protein
MASKPIGRSAGPREELFGLFGLAWNQTQTQRTVTGPREVQCRKVTPRRWWNSPCVDHLCDIQVGIYAPKVPDFHNNVLSIPYVPMRPFCFSFSEPTSDTRILFVRQRKK